MAVARRMEKQQKTEKHEESNCWIWLNNRWTKKKVIKVLYLAETGHRGNHICHLKHDGSTIGPWRAKLFVRYESFSASLCQKLWSGVMIKKTLSRVASLQVCEKPRVALLERCFKICGMTSWCLFTACAKVPVTNCSAVFESVISTQRRRPKAVKASKSVSAVC